MTLLGQVLDFDAAPWFGMWLMFPSLIVLAIVINLTVGRDE